MRFQTSISAFAAFLTLSLASPAPEPQSPSQTEAAVSELVSYAESLATDPAALSFATDEGLLSTIEQLQASLASDVQAGLTPGTSALAVLPTPAQNFVLSIYTAEVSIFQKHGFSVSLPTPTATKSTGGAVSTNAVKIGAGLAAGFMGAVIAL